jgi:ABC-2 type transport system permease protein
MPSRRLATLSGTFTMVRFNLRRDRIRIVVWALALVALTVGTVGQVRDLYPTRADLAAYAATVSDNAAVIAFSGPTYALDTLGGRVAFEMSGQVALAIGLMALLAMSRHTRAEEESGRAELLRSTALGRHAALAAALIVVAGTSALIGALITVTLLAYDLPVAGSIALGTALASVGVVFAAVAAVTAQVSERSRAASGLALAVLGAAFVARIIGDVGSGTASWLSPIGWAQGMRAFAGERWWPLLLALGSTVGFVAVAVVLANHRDLGAGLVQSRPGPANASPALGRPVGFAWRLQRGTIAAWSIGVLLFGAAMGSVANSADELIGDNPDMRDYLAAAGVTNLVDAFLATILLVLALTAGGFAVQSAARLRTEETAGRAESVLATPLPRWRWAGANLTVTLVGTTIVLASAGLGVGAAHAMQAGDAGQIPRLAAAALAYLPAVMVLVGVTVLLFGFFPRATAAGWAAVVVAVVVGIFGSVLQLPDWVTALSPLDHVSSVPAVAISLVPLVALASIALAATVVGVIGFRLRDVA